MKDGENRRIFDLQVFPQRLLELTLITFALVISISVIVVISIVVPVQVTPHVTMQPEILNDNMLQIVLAPEIHISLNLRAIIAFLLVGLIWTTWKIWISNLLSQRDSITNRG